MAGLQLLLSAPRQVLLGAAVGALVGAAQRCNLLGLHDLRVRLLCSQLSAVIWQSSFSEGRRNLQSARVKFAAPSSASTCRRVSDSRQPCAVQVPAPLASALARLFGPLLQGAPRLPPHALAGMGDVGSERHGGAGPAGPSLAQKPS